MSWLDDLRALVTRPDAPQLLDLAPAPSPPAPVLHPSMDTSGTPASGDNPADVTAAFAAQQRDLDAERQRLATERAEFAREQYWAKAETAVDALITSGQVLPAEDQPNSAGKRALVAVFAQALADDATGTAIFGQAGGSRYAALTAAYAARSPQVPVGEQLPVTILPTGPDKAPVDMEARRKELLAASPLGQRALQMQKES